MILKKYILLILLFILATGCQGQDTTGKIIIEYDNDWSAVIIQNYAETGVSGTGKQELTFENPHTLGATVTKQDTSLNKLVVYIYEDERIVAAESTREPQGSVSLSYAFPY